MRGRERDNKKQEKRRTGEKNRREEEEGRRSKRTGDYDGEEDSELDLISYVNFL